MFAKIKLSLPSQTEGNKRSLGLASPGSQYRGFTLPVVPVRLCRERMVLRWGPHSTTLSKDPHLQHVESEDANALGISNTLWKMENGIQSLVHSGAEKLKIHK